MNKKRYQVKLHDEGRKDEWYSRGVEVNDTKKLTNNVNVVVFYAVEEEKAEAMRLAERIAKLLNKGENL